MRPATVALGSLVVAGLAMIALLMGVFAAIPGNATTSCGHLLDRRQSTAGLCSGPLRARRVEVSSAAGVAGLAVILAAIAAARAARA